MALWNDWGNNAITPFEEYYQLARSLAVFAEKSWAGSEVRETALAARAHTERGGSRAKPEPCRGAATG
jgi:hypothetical protein